jgi:hypothetical protein
MVALWIHILFEANWEDKKWQGIVVPRGSFVTSISRLAKTSGLSVQQTRTCLERLKSTHEITIKSTNSYTIITVCKYDVYQLTPGYYQQTDQQTVQQTNNKRITNEQQQLNEENKIINNICVLDNTPAYTREGGVKEDWRFISSVRQSTLGFDKNRIAEFKRNLFRAEVEALAEKVGMIPEQKEAFISWWTESSPNSDKIKAEYEVTFDTENRMRIWADRHKPSQKTQQPKSRMDQLEEDLKFIDNFFYGQQQQHNSAPDEQ